MLWVFYSDSCCLIFVEPVVKTERRSPARGLGVFLSPVWSFVRTHHRPYHRPYHSSYHCLLLKLQTTHNGSLHSLHWLGVARQWLTFSVLLHFTPKHPSVIAIVKFDIYWVWGEVGDLRADRSLKLIICVRLGETETGDNLHNDERSPVTPECPVQHLSPRPAYLRPDQVMSTWRSGPAEQRCLSSPVLTTPPGLQRKKNMLEISKHEYGWGNYISVSIVPLTSFQR